MVSLVGCAMAGCFGGCSIEPPAPVATAPAGSQSSAPPAISTTAPTASGSAKPPAIVPQWTNIAADAGIDFTYFNDAVPNRYFLPEIMGGGAAWGDFDGDGRLDLYLMNGCRLQNPDPTQTEFVNRLFRNVGGDRFEDVTFAAVAEHNGYGQGCAVGDFNADGFPDLYLTNYGPNALLQNNGDGTFTDVTATAGVGDPLWGTGAVWCDVDGDADLDLYVVNYLDVTFANLKQCRFGGVPGYCGPGDYQPQPDRLFVNQADGTFVESLAAFGMSAERGKGLAVVALDLDDDLRPEIYVANDMAPNFLFTRSDGPNARVAPGASLRPFVEVAMAAGCAVSDEGLNEASMGIAVADFDRAGRPDIYLTHFFNHKNTLYHNLGGLVFQDDSRRARIAAATFGTNGFGTVAFDYDRDGAPDLFFTNGHVLGPKYEPNVMRPQLLRNDGRGRFDDISDFCGPYFQERWLGRGVAGGDYDNDGDLDLVVSHLDKPVALLRNDTRAGRHFVGLELRTPSRVPPVGGRVVVTTADRRQTVPIIAGGSYLSSSDPRVLVGVPDDVETATVEIFWPSGRVDRFANLRVDRYWRVLEGEPPELPFELYSRSAP